MVSTLSVGVAEDGLGLAELFDEPAGSEDGVAHHADLAGLEGRYGRHVGAAGSQEPPSVADGQTAEVGRSQDVRAVAPEALDYDFEGDELLWLQRSGG